MIRSGKAPLSTTVS